MRFDILVRIMAWFQILAGLVVVAFVAIFGWLFAGESFWRPGVAMMLAAILIIAAAVPQLVCGLLSLHFASMARLYREAIGSRSAIVPGRHILLRLLMGFSSLWLASLAGISVLTDLIGLDTTARMPRGIGILGFSGVIVFVLALAGPARFARWSVAAGKAKN